MKYINTASGQVIDTPSAIGGGRWERLDAYLKKTAAAKTAVAQETAETAAKPETETAAEPEKAKKGGGAVLKPKKGK